MEESGCVVVEKIRGKSTVTRCFSKYPLKFIVPTKAGSSKTDAVWIYSLSYGGGLVSGDCISYGITVGEDCTTVLKTQASTKVYKSVGSKCSQQILEAKIGRNALLAVIPDPVTCFSSARYSQKQVFRVFSDSSLIIVDWLTSGRHETGEKWEFELYKSTNHIFLEGNEPLFLDSVMLEQGPTTSVAERMQGYQVIAMVILIGPKLKHVQNLVHDEVKKMMSEQFCGPAYTSRRSMEMKSEHSQSKPALIANCSPFGSKAVGMVVRIAAMKTQLVYDFLRHHLASMEPLLGASPYS
ncbi:urease accessory protein D isoform X1 [Tasmannia lanceolata]|uniref:urease accessory protein D isoform X1 n=1 Tax=Tasmannia lanceolata TaxID=3420 RepID=UPI0040643865